jgi:hypothetical protein
VRGSPEAVGGRVDPAAGSRQSRPPLVIGCGALAPELVALTRRAGLPRMDLACLPASLHNRPERIPGAVAARIRRARRDGYDRIFVAYADCGTGGLLDRVLEAEGVERLEGAHCYEVYAGRAAFATLSDEEPGTFYVTDFLARNFDRLVVRGLGLDRHPELLPVYFGNYRRLVYLAQTADPALSRKAATGARLLGLTYERRFTGLGELGEAIATFAGVAAAAAATDPTIESGRWVASDASSAAPRVRDVPESSAFLPLAQETPPDGASLADGLHLAQVLAVSGASTANYLHLVQGGARNLHPWQEFDQTTPRHGQRGAADAPRHRRGTAAAIAAGMPASPVGGC